MSGWTNNFVSQIDREDRERDRNGYWNRDNRERDGGWKGKGKKADNKGKGKWDK